MNKHLRSAALLLAALLITGCISALFGCMPYPIYTEPTQDAGMISLTTVPPQEEVQKTPQPATAAPTAKPTAKPTAAPTAGPTECPVSEDGKYDTKDEVALYLYLFGHLPSNFITKKDAQALGWPGGSLEPYAPGCSIGGDYFGNYEGKLPKAKGRTYHECDIGTTGKSSRGAKRIVYSNDGLIYYTDDHYESFTLLYGGN